MAEAYYWSGDKERAYETYKNAIALAKDNIDFDPDVIISIVSWYGILGIADSALFYLKQANLPKNPDKTDTYKAFEIGELYLAIGEKRKAIEWIESAIKRDYGWIQVKYHPMYKDLIKDPDFQRMIEKYSVVEE